MDICYKNNANTLSQKEKNCLTKCAIKLTEGRIDSNNRN